MPDILTKLSSIEVASVQVGSGSETLETRKSAIKNFIAGDAQTVNAPATTYAFTHTYHDEILTLTGLTAATALNITAGSDIQVGATLFVRVVQGATGYNLTTDAEGLGIVGVANDTDVATFKYFGSAIGYVQVATNKSVDAA